MCWLKPESCGKNWLIRFPSQKSSDSVKGCKGRASDQHILNAFPQIARHFKHSDRADMGPLDNKDGGMYCRQGAPWLESSFPFPLGCQQQPSIFNFSISLQPALLPWSLQNIHSIRLLKCVQDHNVLM